MNAHRFDPILERILFVRSNVSTISSTGFRLQRDPSFRLPLLISATRCIIQYVMLPFGLPLIGVIGGAPAWLGLTFNAVSLISLVSSLRRVWQTRHPRRFTYLPLALLMLFVIVIFAISDLRALRG